MDMNKFLRLCEEFDPEYKKDYDALIELEELLNSAGINMKIKAYDKFEIATENGLFEFQTKYSYYTPNYAEEDEQINAGIGSYEVDSEVEKLGNKASKGLKGLAARGLGTSAQRAKQAVKKREKVAADAVGAYEKGTERIRKGLQQVRSSATNVGY